MIGSLTISLVSMRWGLLSAVIMFFSSIFHTKCCQKNLYGLALIFTGIGIGVSCWFVTGLLGIAVSLSDVGVFWHSVKETVMKVICRITAEPPAN